MSSNPAGPEFSAPGFVGCYRHPERGTGISCQRCHRPICGECMQPASVGFQCPRCGSEARASVRAPRTRYGARLGDGGSTGTTVVRASLALVAVLDLATARLATSLLARVNPAGAGGGP